ncbi:hypothetical protein PP935_gp251 [Rhizobium phage RHph_N34]|uniref:Uncharacterized protein n=1 Tax=Rhizobium phage RHph_N34 TaxID=2509586 RepID=A0A7S5REG5_9CAUD|nr:hypothetical protein PP935_gp251 [Rhizobium phage RHph_N34]QIG74026.1 hypothetical protein EVC06_251 [Rhizobium phage RHph_N34]
MNITILQEEGYFWREQMFPAVPQIGAKLQMAEGDKIFLYEVVEVIFKEDRSHVRRGDMNYYVAIRVKFIHR